ncbi:unnamed protein product [Plutella xylostella]|uniref:Sucrose-6-phosphate hydrolase n=1 Tax=Plutella xylostella TaxID=51655 RepID=A0A8S4EN90_PLUXY|nr:unnamed protein product [Plutella xylostella]
MKLLVATSLLLLLVTVYGSDSLARQNATLEQYIMAESKKVNQRYRLQYHVAAPVGWINDPNGFSYYKEQYHLFYQYYPYEAKWGPMHWGHVVSKDLVTWEYRPTALVPGEEQCFSGSAVEVNGSMVLMYTAHVVKEGMPVNQSQYLAFSDDGVNFEKFAGNPVIPASPNNSPDFRDPKAWKHGDYWYVIIGSKTDDEIGTVLLYRSKNMIDWEFLTILAQATSDLGYMWECPDFFELGGKHILLMSPQGMVAQGDRFKNLYQTGYIVGQFDYETFTFTQETAFQELDYGHDFYAAQTIASPDGKRVLIGWFGMWETAFPEAKDGWAGAMTIARELVLDSNNHILMKPLTAQSSLRNRVSLQSNLKADQVLELEPASEVLIEADLTQSINLLLEGRSGGGKAWLKWDPSVGKVVVEREEGDVRQVEWSPGSNKAWRLFLDTSSLELFCGDGEAVFSSRVYPLGGWKLSNLGTQAVNTTAYALKRSVPSYNSAMGTNLKIFNVLCLVLFGYALY